MPIRLILWRQISRLEVDFSPVVTFIYSRGIEAMPLLHLNLTWGLHHRSALPLYRLKRNVQMLERDAATLLAFTQKREIAESHVGNRVSGADRELADSQVREFVSA